MEYSFQTIENKWQQYWRDNKTYQVNVDHNKPKFYVLDMFPYPSGAGLHVGHPLGYIASDIFSRYKRSSGFNVLHPMGYDAYGLPAEQYAIQTGQHPAITTDKNIKRYREQLDKIGFSFDWDREIRTCDPEYYQWTQWAFIQMFHHWYNKKTDRAEPIKELIATFEKEGNKNIDAASNETPFFSSEEWTKMDAKEQQTLLLNYRIAYLADTDVNWCPALGTVLANDEVQNGHALRGGHPVIQKTMKQWCLRVSAYAERLLNGLDDVEWTESLKEIQRNWIGKSEGALIHFPIKEHQEKMSIFTTRPDTLWGVTFMALAPESEWVDKLTKLENKESVDLYVSQSRKKTERERIADTEKTGVFTGAYCEHPFTKEPIPIWVSDYVLAGYGTGAIMAVPAHDQRDYDFAKKFDLPIIPVIEGGNIENGAFDSKEAKVINSDFITGLMVPDAISKVIDEIEKQNLGKRQVNYKIRDAIFSRQRYWGEPFPVYYKDDIPYTLDEDQLPLTLPEVDAYKPTEDGAPPLGRAKNWTTKDGYPLELSTMPGFAGSSAYYLRYMDPRNKKALVSKEANEYWRNVDLYVGGTEHATGHLIYSRFWNKFLYDTGVVCEKEPFRKLVNQGMIQGRSNFVYRLPGSNTFVSKDMIGKNLPDDQLKHLGLEKNAPNVTEIHVDVNIVNNDILDIEAFKAWNPEYKDAQFILNEKGQYICGWAIEKMSKSMFNVVNPDDIIEQYGADTLRLYEMFLGPLEQSKPWDTKGIDGVYRFLKKFWNLFFDKEGHFILTNEQANPEELKTLHKTIKKVRQDIERFSFNTAISSFMICINELTDLKCNKKAILEPLTILLAPFAPHICEELWHLAGHKETVCDVPFPQFNEEHLIEDTFEYPVSFNGKLRFKKTLSKNLSKEEIEKAVLEDPYAEKWLDRKSPKKIIVVPNKIVNIVI